MLLRKPGRRAMNTSTAGAIAPPQAAAVAKLRPVLAVGLLTIAGTLLLEIWRPYFYLTDDNFSGYVPGAVEFSRKLWTGQWPFINDHIFGGNYNLLADPAGLTVFSPWLLIFSWVALTPYYYALADIVSLCNSLAIACSFCWSALWLREKFDLAAPDWLIITLSLSYAFTPYNFIVGSSWIGFLNGQAAFPLILVGFFHASHVRGILLQAAGLFYSLFGGHAHTFVILCLFSGVVSIVVSVGLRTPGPALRLIAAAVLLGVVTLPLLLPSLTGFQASPRAAGISVLDASRTRILPVPLATSYVLGPISSIFAGGLSGHGHDVVFNLSIAFAFANLGIVFGLFFVRKLSVLSVAMIVCFLAAALLVMRPAWLAGWMSQLPLLKSLQWPFRELWLMHFSAHIFLLLNYRAATSFVLTVVASVSTVVFSGVFFNLAPTFYLFDLDRQLVLSGEADRYWSSLVRAHGSEPRIIVGLDPRYLYLLRDEIPFSLLGTYGFGSLYQFVSQSGYTFTVAPRNQGKTGQPRPYAFPGAYLPLDARAISEADPDLWRIDLVSLRPAEWTITTGVRQRRFRLTPETHEVVELRVIPMLSEKPEPSTANPPSASKP